MNFSSMSVTKSLLTLLGISPEESLHLPKSPYPCHLHVLHVNLLPAKIPILFLVVIDHGHLQ